MLGHRLTAPQDQQRARWHEQEREPDQAQRDHAMHPAQSPGENSEGHKSNQAGNRAHGEQAVDGRYSVKDRLAAGRKQERQIPPEGVDGDQPIAPVRTCLTGVFNEEEHTDPHGAGRKRRAEHGHRQSEQPAPPFGPFGVQHQPVIGEQHNRQHHSRFLREKGDHPQPDAS